MSALKRSRLLGFLPKVQGQKTACAKFDFMDMLLLPKSLGTSCTAERFKAKFCVVACL
jgi:hypothetical protein